MVEEYIVRPLCNLRKYPKGLFFIKNLYKISMQVGVHEDTDYLLLLACILYFCELKIFVISTKPHIYIEGPFSVDNLHLL